MIMVLSFVTNIKAFEKVPGHSFAYWCRNFSIFNLPKLNEYYISGGRTKTHNNELYVRNWWEIQPSAKWQPYANGGEYRKWYGNNFDLVDWSEEARTNYDKHGGLYNHQFWGRQGICWNLITSSKNSFKIKENSFHYSSGSPTIISNDNALDLAVVGFLNTNLASYLLQMINPTLNTTVSDVLGLPFMYEFSFEAISIAVQSCTKLEREDWNSFELSWGFKKHPLV